MFLSWLRKNVFKRVFQCLVRISFGSGCVWYFRSCSSPLPGYPRRAVLLVLCLALVLQIMPGGVASMGSLWRSVPDRPEVSRMVPGRGENTKKMYDKSEAASKPGRFELEKSEKNCRNLKLIQACDFLFLCILYIIFCNVARRDVNFHFITFNSSFPVMFLRPTILKSLLRRFFCRPVSLFLRFADPLLIVPMVLPF